MLDLADELFFGRSAFLEDEPLRVLRDESIAGLNAQSVLEAVGRGAEKPSKIAARLGTAQTNLGRTFQQLLAASILTREIPFGESLRSTKKSRNRIQDPALRFWFQVYSPHRTRWQTYRPAEREKLIHDHASTVFEDFCRQQHPDATRYWEANVEFDFVRDDHGCAVVSEVKFKKLAAAEHRQLAHHLTNGWRECALSRRFRDVRFEILDATTLEN